MNAAPVLEWPDSTHTLVDVLLEDQRALSAVERFSDLHARGQLEARERRYRRLLPATTPGPGQQYAFEVDLDKCSGCKACVTACHSLNGLDEEETWRSVGLLVSDSKSAFRIPRSEGTPEAGGRGLQFQRGDSFGVTDPDFGLQHLTTACHHCADPGCLNGCPVLAYDKDPVTGIVRHLDDQCIGCQYCVMKCPYDVPKYSKRLGIVRKCDLCRDRLAVGEAPACAQACPNEAIKVTLVGDGVEANDGVLEPWTGGTRNSIIPSLRDARTAPRVFPDPSITRPTTRFLTRRANVASMQASDSAELTPGPSHPPLSVMLVLTQLGVGLMGATAVLEPRASLPVWVALGVTLAGVLAATLHLGQPLKAWRGFLGWRRSWLSRELLAFGLVLGAMSAHALFLRPATAWAALLVGAGAVACSAMIYVDTRRDFWSARLTFPKFALTTILLGAAGALAIGATAGNRPWIAGAAMVLIPAALGKLALESGFVIRDFGCQPVLSRSALLHLRAFRGWFFPRLAFGAVGGVWLPALLLSGHAPPGPALAVSALAACVAGELIERHLFFVCEAAPRMPGGVAR